MHHVVKLGGAVKLFPPLAWTTVIHPSSPHLLDSSTAKYTWPKASINIAHKFASTEDVTTPTGVHELTQCKAVTLSLAWANVTVLEVFHFIWKKKKHKMTKMNECCHENKVHYWIILSNECEVTFHFISNGYTVKEKTSFRFYAIQPSVSKWFLNKHAFISCKCYMVLILLKEDRFGKNSFSVACLVNYA